MLRKSYRDKKLHIFPQNIYIPITRPQYRALDCFRRFCINWESHDGIYAQKHLDCQVFSDEVTHDTFKMTNTKMGQIKALLF